MASRSRGESADGASTVLMSRSRMAVPLRVITDAGWNWTEAKPGPRRAWTSPVTGSRHTRTGPGRLAGARTSPRGTRP